MVIQIECIDEIVKLVGIGELVLEVIEWVMCGELDFIVSLCQCVVMLKDVDVSILLQVCDVLLLMLGLVQLVFKLEMLGWKVVIVFGGFIFFVEYLCDKLYFDVVFVNELEICDGKFIGNVFGDIVDVKYKVNMLCKLVEKYEILMV